MFAFRGATQPMHFARTAVNGDVDRLMMHLAEKTLSRERTEKGKGMFLHQENSFDGLKITIKSAREA